MNRRIALLGAGALLVLLGGCAGTYSYETVGVVPMVRRWEDPRFVQARVLQRLDTIEQHVRDDIAHGRLPAETINAFNAQRAQIENTLRFAAADGFIDRNERFQLRQMVQAAAAIPQQHLGVYGGGPGYGPPYGYAPRPYQYYDPSWDWGL